MMPNLDQTADLMIKKSSKVELTDIIHKNGLKVDIKTKVDRKIGNLMRKNRRGNITSEDTLKKIQDDKTKKEKEEKRKKKL